MSTGDAGPARSLLASAPPPSTILALRAALGRAGLDTLPAVAEIDALLARAHAGDAALASACVLLARDAVVRLDAPWTRAWADRAARAAAGAGERVLVEAQAAELWAQLAESRSAGLRESARALEARASRLGLAETVIELAALAALTALAEDDLEGARSVARRASRMARTEALPQAEYVAHAVLARVRRFEGRPHLATRILAALARVAPGPIRGWLALELALAGAIESATALSAQAPACRAAHAVLTAFGACSAGDGAALASALDAARVALGPFAAFADELAPLAIALDPRAPVPVAGALAEFLSGRSDAIPGPLTGPASIPRTGEPAGAVRVVALSSGARRVLGVGLDLCSGLAELGRESGTRQHRREAMIAVLALAGPAGLPREALFRAVWGFAFAPHLHQGVLDVALHRMRPALTSAAQLVRLASGNLALRVEAPFAVTDPRVERPIDDRVLARMAALGDARAKDLADDLDVPLRTVQAALQRLADEGECVRAGEGQKSAYRVEDTTFREPTRS